MRFALLRFAPLRSAVTRFTPTRFAPVRSGTDAGRLSLHLFQTFVPCLSKSRCFWLAMVKIVRTEEVMSQAKFKHLCLKSESRKLLRKLAPEQPHSGSCLP
jgi:hypothetical protein